MLAILNRGQVDPALKRIALATQSLLRDTIDLDEEQWHAPSLLPGWSRAHVATHIARNADALRRVLSATLMALAIVSVSFFMPAAQYCRRWRRY